MFMWREESGRRRTDGKKKKKKKNERTNEGNVSSDHLSASFPPSVSIPRQLFIPFSSTTFKKEEYNRKKERKGHLLMCLSSFNLRLWWWFSEGENKTTARERGRGGTNETTSCRFLPPPMSSGKRKARSSSRPILKSFLLLSHRIKSSSYWLAMHVWLGGSRRFYSRTRIRGLKKWIWRNVHIHKEENGSGDGLSGEQVVAQELEQHIAMTVAIVSMERGKCYCLQKGTLGRRRRRGEIFFHTCVTSAGAFVLPPSPTTLRHPIWPSRPLQQRKREKELRGTQPHSRLLFFRSSSSSFSSYIFPFFLSFPSALDVLPPPPARQFHLLYVTG